MCLATIRVAMESDRVITNDVMGLRKRLVNKDSNNNGSPSRNRRPTVSTSVLDRRTAFIAAIAISVCLVHGLYLQGLFENDLFFSSLSPLERELTFRTEMGLYYSYYKTVVNADRYIVGLKELLTDNVTEYPSTINTMKRFNLYPEVVLGLAYRTYSSVLRLLGTSGMQCYTTTRGHDLPPVQACNGLGDETCFYVWCVFALNGALPSFLFILSTHLSDSILGGCLSLVMFFYNHSEATRVMWTPPLRESFALPFLYLQLIFLSRVLRHASPTALDYVGLCLSSLCFLLPWQFSPLALLTQTLSLLLLHTLRVLPAGKHATILLSLAVAFLLNVLLQFGNTLLLSSFFPASIVTGLLLSALATTFNRIPWKYVRVVLELSFGLLVTVLLKMVAGFALGNTDDAHITSLLLSKLTSYSDFHTQLYTCSAEFDTMPLEYPINLTTTLLLPAGVVVIVAVLWRMRPGSVDVDPSLPEQLYHVIQCVVFGGLALLVMRLKVFLTPQLAVLSCLLVKVKIIPTQRAPVLVLCVILVSSLSGLRNIQHQLSIEGEFSNPHQEHLVNWVISSTNRNAVFAGAMPTMATIKLCTGRPIVNHPHYEDSQLRHRTKRVYTIYSRKPPSEVSATLRSLNVSHVIIEGAWCRKAYREGCWFGDVWDREDPDNQGRPMFCELVEEEAELSGFEVVFRNKVYTVLKLVD